MNTEKYQKISLLVDDELDSSEQESLLYEIRQETELNNKLNRYQAVSHALKTDDFVMANKGFLDQVKQGIQQEPSYFLPQKKPKTRVIQGWQKKSMAIAASIAVVAVIVTQQNELSSPDKGQGVVVAESEQAVKEKVQVANKRTQNLQHQRFKEYLQAHSDDLYTHGSLNYQPYGRVANYGQE